ncbi:MAG: DUF2298 domain-containing protein [Sumerlaeia bacterium]
MISLIIWGVGVVFISAAWYPLAAKLFADLPDKGLTASLPLGVLLTTLSIWLLGQPPLWSGEAAVSWRAGILLLSTLYGFYLVFKKQGFAVYWDKWFCVGFGIFAALVSVPFSLFSCVLAILLAAVANYGIHLKFMGESFKFTRSQLALGGLGILLYFCGFLGFAYIRAQVPDITFNPGASGAEKMGNMMHLTTVMRAGWFPPQDAWAAGFATNYYYGGHLSIALLTKLSAQLPWVGFNLGLCHTVGLILASAYCLGLVLCQLFHAKARGVYQGLMSAFFAFAVGIMGNADMIFQSLQASEFLASKSIVNLIPVVNGYALLAEQENQLRGIDYWQSSRVIHGAPEFSTDAGTITEFPFFSALLGDLHPHHLAHPYLILGITAALISFLIRRTEKSALHFFVLGLICGSLFFINTWDCIFLSSFVMVLFVTGFVWKQRFDQFKEIAFIALGFIPIVALFLVYFSKPEAVHFFEPKGLNFMLQQIGLKLVQPEIRTKPLEFLIHFWPFVFALVFSFKQGSQAVHLLPLLAAFLLGNIIFFQLVLFAILFVLNRDNFFPPLLLMCASVSIGVEVVLINDHYTENFDRYNTLFKFYYSLWPLCWALLFATLLRSKIQLQGVGVLLISSIGLLYPLLGTTSRLQYSEQQFTLSGIQWMKDSPEWQGDAAFAEWIWANPTNKRTLLVESASAANASSYNSEGRLASLTGLPSLVGWTHHEMQWRGWGVQLQDPLTNQPVLIDDLFNKRRALAKSVYESGDLSLLNPYFRLYDRILIVVSEQERQANSLAAPLLSMKPIWSSEGVDVYEYNR